MKNMSFSLTTTQILSRTKTVTRRKSWSHLRPGELICACKKTMGLKAGEKIERLAVLYITKVDLVPLSVITAEDVAREGFPGMTPSEFVEMFCYLMRAQSWQSVWRIEFRYVPGDQIFLKE